MSRFGMLLLLRCMGVWLSLCACGACAFCGSAALTGLWALPSRRPTATSAMSPSATSEASSEKPPAVCTPHMLPARHQDAWPLFRQRLLRHTFTSRLGRPQRPHGPPCSRCARAHMQASYLALLPHSRRGRKPCSLQSHAVSRSREEGSRVERASGGRVEGLREGGQVGSRVERGSGGRVEGGARERG
eukprot:1250722-Rhodomonas_salina.1